MKPYIITKVSKRLSRIEPVIVNRYHKVPGLRGHRQKILGDYALRPSGLSRQSSLPSQAKPAAAIAGKPQ
jgi:hypothetical protein